MEKQLLFVKFKCNPAIRIISWPIENLRRYFHVREFAKSEDSRFLASLKNKYEGKRCFVIGNGPSLTPSDLDKLKDEVTFATNRIYYIYPKCLWRPTYYICSDINVIASEIENIKKSGNYTKLINYKAKRYGRKPDDKLWYICLNGRFTLRQNTLAETTMSSDISKYCTSNGTVTVTAAEIAIYLGFKEIYLIGVDNNYIRKIDKNGRVYEDNSVKASYFDGMRDGQGALNTNNIFAQPVDYVDQSFKLLKKFAEDNSVKVYNATRGGKLEVFERVDFDSIVK